MRNTTSFRISPGEAALVREAADRAGIGPSTFVRDAALAAAVEIVTGRRARFAAASPKPGDVVRTRKHVKASA